MDIERDRLQNQKRLVSAARAIIAHEIALPLGCRRTAKVLHWLNDPAITYPVFEAFVAATKSSNLPIGSDRLYWNKDKLRERDVVLNEFTNQYREQVVSACWEILERFAPEGPDSHETGRFGRNFG